MSNYPLGAENDPRAPWNGGDEEDLLENIVDDAKWMAIQDITDLISTKLYDEISDHYISEAAYEYIKDEHTSDFVANNKQILVDEVFDRVMETIKHKLYERS